MLHDDSKKLGEKYGVVTVKRKGIRPVQFTVRSTSFYLTVMVLHLSAFVSFVVISECLCAAIMLLAITSGVYHTEAVQMVSWCMHVCVCIC